MNYVYICRPGENEELKYSIRCLEKFTNVESITIFGNAPDWFNGNVIKVKDIGRKFANIHNLVYTIANNPNVPEDFILMNDDFFIIKPIDKFELCSSGLLDDKINKFKSLRPSSGYLGILGGTNKYLKKIGIEAPKDFDIHVPMPIKKSILRETIKHNSLHRSTYGNLCGLPSKEITDVKVYVEGILSKHSFDYENSDLPFISTMDSSFIDVFNNVLSKLDLQKTKFEK